MADANEINDAYQELRDMLKEINQDIKLKPPKGDFNDLKVAWLIVHWIRVGTSMRGSGYYSNIKPFVTKKRTPDRQDPRFTRAGELWADLNIYRNAIADKGGDDATFTQAERSMLNFLWEYWQHFKPNSKEEKTFEHILLAKLMDEEKSMSNAAGN